MTVEKQAKYVDEVSRLWRAKKAFMVPIIIGALGSDLLETLNLPLYLFVLFRTASILRRYLQI